MPPITTTKQLQNGLERRIVISLDGQKKQTKFFVITKDGSKYYWKKPEALKAWKTAKKNGQLLHQKDFFFCHSCNKKFAGQSGLWYHNKTNHGKESRPYNKKNKKSHKANHKASHRANNKSSKKTNKNTIRKKIINNQNKLSSKSRKRSRRASFQSIDNYAPLPQLPLPLPPPLPPLPLPPPQSSGSDILKGGKKAQTTIMEFIQPALERRIVYQYHHEKNISSQTIYYIIHKTNHQYEKCWNFSYALHIWNEFKILNKLDYTSSIQMEYKSNNSLNHQTRTTCSSSSSSSSSSSNDDNNNNNNNNDYVVDDDTVDSVVNLLTRMSKQSKKGNSEINSSSLTFAGKKVINTKIHESSICSWRRRPRKKTKHSSLGYV
jgi:hypothetical protein